MKRLVLSGVMAILLVSSAQAQSFGPDGQAVDAGAWFTRLQWDWSWDEVSGIGIARGAQGEWRFRDGGAFAVRGGRLIRLPLAAYREGGRLMVPVSVLPKPELQTIFVQKVSAMTAATVSPARRLQRVVVDAGHGGRDTGAISPFGTREKDLVLQVALAVRDELIHRGLEVKMTRDTDVFIPLPERAKIANEWKADLFVSIHANASESRTLRGFEIYTLSEETDDTILARARAESSGPAVDARKSDGNKALDVILWDMRSRENRRQAVRVAEQVSGTVAGYAPVEARRLKNANFHVLKNTECPAVLIEIGYLTNRRDQTRLSSARYRRSLVDGIVGGIWTFKREYEATDGFAR